MSYVQVYTRRIASPPETECGAGGGGPRRIPGPRNPNYCQQSQGGPTTQSLGGAKRKRSGLFARMSGQPSPSAAEPAPARPAAAPNKIVTNNAGQHPAAANSSPGWDLLAGAQPHPTTVRRASLLPRQSLHTNIARPAQPSPAPPVTRAAKKQGSQQRQQPQSNGVAGSGGGDSGGMVVDDDEIAREVEARMSRHRSRRMRNKM